MKGMVRVFAVWVFIVVLAAGLMGLAGCKGKVEQTVAEKTVEKMLEKATGGKADIDLEEGKIKVKSADGETEVSTGAAEWPNDMPGGVPKFTQGKVKGVTRASDRGSKTWNVILEEIEDGAWDKYAETLKSNGWTILQSMNMGEGGSLQAAKDKLLLVAMFNNTNKNASMGVSQEAAPQ